MASIVQNFINRSANLRSLYSPQSRSILQGAIDGNTKNRGMVSDALKGLTNNMLGNSLMSAGVMGIGQIGYNIQQGNDLTSGIGGATMRGAALGVVGTAGANFGRNLNNPSIPSQRRSRLRSRP